MRAVCVAVALTLVWTLASRVAAADQVLLLKSQGASAWEAGRARIAVELELAGFEVVQVAPDSELAPTEIVKRLQVALAASSALGAVATTSSGDLGQAYVATRVDGSIRVQRVSTASANDPAEVSIIALRVVELLNMSGLTIDLPETPEPKPVAIDPNEERPRPWLAWVGAGPALSSDASAAFLGHLGFRRQLGDRWHLELSGYAAIVPYQVSVLAGEASVRAAALQLHAGWTLNPGRRWSVDLALGGGGLLAGSEASAADGFDDQRDTTTATVLSARIRVRYVLDPRASVLVGAEPGVIIPALSVRGASAELARLGRPWIPLSVGVGWSF